MTSTYWENREAGRRGQGEKPDLYGRRVVTLQIQHLEPIQKRYPDIFTDDRLIAAYENRDRFICEHEGPAFYLSKSIVKKFKLKKGVI